MPRKRPKDLWPWQHETPLERREHLARLYRDKLYEFAPAACLELDADAVRFGQGWVTPQTAIYEDDDLLTVELVADLEKVIPRTVDNWVGAGLKVTETPDGNRFRYADVLEFRAKQRRRRIEQRKARRAERAAFASRDLADVPL